MTKPREGRLARIVKKIVSRAQADAAPATESRWVREPRPVLPPLKVGREWDRVRRIAYL
jgi:hypothetical protein